MTTQMNRNRTAESTIKRRAGVFFALSLSFVLTLTGCKADSFMNPSVVGRHENTPVMLPILDRLAVIEPLDAETVVVSPVTAADLEPEVSEYTIGVGDQLRLGIFELLYPNQESTFNNRVDETGQVRLPIVGAIQAAGYSPSALEEAIAQDLADKNYLFDAIVSVAVLSSQQNTFTLLGEPEQGRTRIGVYAIPRPDFRVLEALALAGGVRGRTKSVLIIRQIPLTPDTAGDLPDEPVQTGNEVEVDPNDLLNQLIEDPSGEGTEQPADEAPAAIDAAVDSGGRAGYVFVNGEWVRVGDGTIQIEDPTTEDLTQYITQRVIEIPYDRLARGELQYKRRDPPGRHHQGPRPERRFRLHQRPDQPPQCLQRPG